MINKTIAKQLPNRWTMAPLVLLRTSNLPYTVFESLKYERTMQNFKQKLNSDISNIVWSEDEIKDFDIDKRIVDNKMITIIGDQKFWNIYHPFVFKHGPHILSDQKSFQSFPQNKFTTSDYNLFYKKITHMATRHNFSFNFNTCITGRIRDGQSANMLVPRLSGRGEKKILLECWAQEALKNKLDVDINLMQIHGRYFFKPACSILKPLEKTLNQFVSAKQPEHERILFECCKKIFYRLTELPPYQQTGRFREIISFIRISKKEIVIGENLTVQLQAIANSLGTILESFSFSSSNTFLSLIKQGIPSDKAFDEAVSAGTSSLSSNFEGPAQGFLFGFDFMLCASSIKDINKGHYKIVVSDVNIFPGGFEIFFNDESAAGELANETVKLFSKSMLSLADNSTNIGLLNDSEAVKNNQRWRERIRVLVDCLRDHKVDPQPVSYYPVYENHQKQLTLPAFWFIRQGFFSSFSEQAMIGINNNVFNHFFFSYAIQHRKTLGIIIEKLKMSLPAVPIKTRECVLLNIDDCLRLFCHKNCFSKPETALSDWFTAYRFFHNKNFGSSLFLKTEETKRFAPMCIDLDNFRSFKIFISSLKKLSSIGIKDVIIERMSPTKPDFWLKKGPVNFPCEIRTFIVKSSNSNK